MAKLKKQLALVGGASGKKGKTPVEANDTLRSRAMINFIDLIGEGMIGGLVDGEKSIYLDDVPLQNPDGTYNFPRNAFKTEFREGAQVQDPLTVVSESGTTYVSGVEIKKNIPATFVIDNVEADRVRIIIGLPALFAQQDNGDVTAATVQYSLEMAVNGGSFRPVADDSGKSTFTLSEKTRSKHQRQHTVTLPKPAKTWSIRVNRITADSTTSKVTDGTYLDSYIELIDAKFTYPNSAVAATTIDSALFSDIPKRAYFVNGIKIQVPSNYDVATGTYNGIWDGTFKLASSSNPSYIMRDILLSKRYGLGRFISPNQIENASFYKAGRYCDEMVPNGYGGFEPRFTINTEIAKQVEAYTLLNDIASVFRSSIFWAGAMVKLTQDAPTPVTKIFNQANVHPKGFSYSGSARKDRHSVVIVTWNDPDNGYKQTPEYVEDADLVARWGIRETQVIAFGCTSRSQAHRVGRWLLYSEASESNLINFDTGLEGAVLLPGEVIQIHDTKRAGKRLGGRLIAGGSLTKAVLDAPVALPNAASTIAIMMPDGAFLERTIKQTGGEFTEITWDSPLPEMPVANALWTISLPNLKPMQARVVGVTQNKDDESFYSVTAVEHNPMKFAAIEEGIALERPLVSLVDERPPAPGNPTFYPSRYAVMNESFGMKGLLSWEGNSPSYIVSYRRQGNPWIQVTVDQATFEVPNVELATYDFEIIAVSPLGKQSPVATLSYEVSGSTLVMGEVMGLELESGSSSEEVKVKWLRTPSAVGYEVQVVETATGKIGRQVAMGNVQRFEYSLADSIFDGGPFRSVTLKVRALGAAGEKGPWAEVTTGNPQIGELLGLSLEAAIKSFFITFEKPADPDFAGALAWISTDPTCPTTQENLVYDNVGNLIYISTLPDGSPLEGDQTYYVRVAGYDSYGRDGLTYSNALAGKPLSMVIGPKEITSEMLADGVIDTAKFAQDIEPIKILSVVNDATPYQNLKVVMSASDGEIYRWSLTENRYTKDIKVENVTGTFGPGHIAPGAIDATKVADGLEFVGIVTSLPNPVGYTGTPVVLYQNKLYRLVNGKWEANVSAADVTGQLTNDQIEQIAATKVTGQIVADQIAQGQIDASKMAPNAEVIQRVTSLPATAGYTGPQVLLYQGKLYRLVNGAWETGVEPGDIIGQITADKLAAGSVRFDTLAPGLEVIATVTALPAVAGYTGPKVVMLNGKLHRLNNGKWEATVDAADIQGTLSNAQIGGIDATKVTGQMSSDQIAQLDAAKLIGEVKPAQIGVGTIDASKLANGLTPIAVVTFLPATAGYTGPKVVMFQEKLYRLTAAGWVTSIAAADIAGTIQATQIAAVEASKVTGQLSDTQIAGLAAAKISGTIVNGQIAAGAVTPSKMTGGSTGFALNADPNLTDPAAWVSHYNSALAPNFVTIEDGLVGTRAVRKVGSVGLINFWNYTAERIPVVAGERYRFTAAFRRTADTPAQIYFTYRPYGPGIAASDYRYVLVPLTTVDTWTRLEAVITVPAGLVAMSPGFSMNHGSATGVVEMQDYRFEAVLPSGLLLDGIITETKIAKDAITAPKIAAGAIVAGKLDVNAVVAGNIAANAVTTDKLMAGAVSTGKLDSLAVTAEKIAANAITTPKIEAGAVKAAQIDSGAVTTAKLDALAVTADKIAVRAISAEKLDVGAVTADKIAAGAVTTEALATYSITASKMAIGDMTNYCSNGMGLTMDGWGPGVPGGMTATTSGFEYWAQFGLAVRSGFNVQCRDSTFGVAIPVLEGHEFHVSADTTPFGGGTTLRNFGVGFQLFDGNGNIAGWAPVAARGVGTVGYQRITGVYRVPAGVTRVNVWLQIDGAGGVILGDMGIGHHVTNIDVRRRASGELIVDGAITAQKILAGAVQTDKLDANAVTAVKIATGAITADKIGAGEVVAGKLAASAVVADNLAAKSVTTEKIEVGAVKAAQIDAGAVTAAKITISDLSNLVINDFSTGNTEGWGTVAGTMYDIPSDAQNPWGRWQYGSSARDQAAGPIVPVSSGEFYYASVWAHNNKPATAFMLIEFMDAAFNRLNLLWNFGTDVKSAWMFLEGQFEIPTNVSFIRMILQTNGGAEPDTRCWWAKPRLRRAANGSLIVDGAITASKIQAKAIVAGKLDTDAVVAGTVAASAITGREIKAGSISADKLLVSTRGATINEDPYLKDPTAWIERDAPAGGYALMDIEDGPVGLGGVMNTTAPYYNLVSRPFAVVAGKTYRITVWTRSFNSANGANYVRLYRTGPGLSYFSLGYEGVPVLGPWTPLTFICKIENGINMATLSFHANWGGTQGNVQIQDFRIEEVLPSTLIQDGAITTEKLTVGSVTAEKILTGAVTADKIGAGQVVAGKLAADSVLAGNVSADAIGAREIKAGAITTSKLLVIPESLIPDPTFKDWEFWNGPGTDLNGWWADNDPGGMQASRCAVLWSGRYDYVGTARKHIFSNPIQMTTGGQVMRFRATVNNNSNQDCYVETQIFGAVGQWLATATIVAKARSGVVVHKTQFTAPEGCSFSRIVIYNHAGYAFQDVIYVTNVLLDRANGSDMIVDGAITATKISAGAIDATKMTANSVLADAIAADAVTSIKIKAGSVKAEHIEARAIKAGALDVDAVVAGTVAAAAINTREIAAGAITIAKLGAGFGVNLVPNTTFVSNDGTLPTGWTYAQTAEMGMRIGVDWAGFKPATGHCIFMEHLNTWHSGADWNGYYGTFQSPFVPCEPGQRYEFSVYAGSHRAALFAAILFYGADGQTLLANVSGSANINEGAGGATMDTWKRIGGFAYAPAGAASVRIELRKGPTDPGQANSYAFWTMPMIALATPNQSAFSAWQPTGLFTTITADGLATGAVTAEKIRAGSVKADHIESLAIKTNHIEAGAVDATKIKTKTITAGQIQAGAIGVDEIAAGAILTKHLAVGDFENLVNCGTGLAVTGFAPHITVQADFVDFQTAWWNQIGKQSPYTLTLRGRDNFYGPMIPVSADDEFYCSIMSVPSGNVPPAFSLGIGLACYTASGQIVNWIGGAGRAPGFAGPHFAEGTVKIPRDGLTTMVQVWLQIGGPGNSNWEIPGNSFHVGGLTVRRKSAGKMIVDGSITADKINTNAIETRHILARQIESEHIKVNEIRGDRIFADSITGDKIAGTTISGRHITGEAIEGVHIKGGTITGDKIYGKQITSDHISVGSLNAISANLGVVTAGRAQNANGQNFINLDAVGDQAFIQVGFDPKPAVRIRANGEGEFARRVLSMPDVWASHPYWPVPNGGSGWLQGGVRQAGQDALGNPIMEAYKAKWETYIDTGVTFEEAWNVVESNMFVGSCRIADGYSGDYGLAGFGKTTVVIGQGLTYGGNPYGAQQFPVQRRVYLHFQWEAGMSDNFARILVTHLAWKLVRV